ncbi:MAG: DNA-deoxyinosine glycosylase [Hespellia sp.]|nr:DNA-deoxyinosine glycosylase [Hespellia sp.]
MIEKMKAEHQTHEFPPVYDEASRILILGSFPSVKSREQHFYYGHPQNRFWKVLARILECEIPATVEDKKEMLLLHHIALWDVIESCDITGSSDSSIRNVVVNDFNRIFKTAEIRCVYANGATAKKLYEKYAKKMTEKPITGLPSTSPANAAYSVERLMESWIQIKHFL